MPEESYEIRWRMDDGIGLKTKKYIWSGRYGYQ
jgi:hypothetical protein